MKRTAEARVSQFFTSGLPVRLHLRHDLHLARKAWHMVMGIAVCGVYIFSGMSNTTAVLILSSVLGFDLLVETARLRIPSFNEKVIRVWGPFMRECEIDRMSGAPHYLLACVLAFGIFPKAVAILSILYLACGDPIASLFGIIYGKNSLRLANGKTLVGTAAGMVTCAVVTFLMLKAIPVSASDGVILALTLIGGFAGGAAELIPLDMDDNFTIPIVSGFVLWLAFIAFGI